VRLANQVRPSSQPLLVVFAAEAGALERDAPICGQPDLSSPYTAQILRICSA
jgi:hypothetical protein